MSSFAILQDKLENWLEDYAVNTCDQNVNRCMEIIELNSRLQSQLFRLLGLASSDGGVYGGASVIKSRLLPWLSTQHYGAGLFPSSVTDAALDALSEAAAKDRQLQQVQDMYERSLKDLESDLSMTKAEADDLKIELAVRNDELDHERRKSTSDKMFTEAEVSDLRTKVRLLEDELALVRSQAGRADSYERQIGRLRDEVALLSTQRSVMTNGGGDAVDGGDVVVERPRSRSPLRSSGSYVDQILEPAVQRYRQQKLIARFNDMFAVDRLNAMDILRQYTEVGDHENNQRILFAAIQEAFRATRLAFSSIKMKIRSTLAVTHNGPETLDEAVQNYIDRHRSELYETADLVDDVVRALDRNPGLYLPTGVSYMVIHSFIRESCKLAWSMFALPRSLDIAPAASLELFDDTRYRRSYDSDLAAPLVTHHIWPCLLMGSRVLMKGEACAIRGAVLARSRSASRSASPSRQRTTSPYRASRSPSPRRKTGSGSSSERL